MNKVLILSTLLGVAALMGILYSTHHKSSSNLRSTEQEFATEFKQYALKFNKNYGHDEGFYRYENYVSNMQIIAKQNALYKAGNSTYFLGENDLTDMSQAEYKSKLLGFILPSKQTVSISAEVTIDTSAPSAVDWTTKGAVNPVKNQGQCGSCWAFSATSALESLNFIKNGKLVSLSEQSLVDCASSYGNNGCNGGLMDAAFKYSADHGMPTESSYAYKAADGTCQTFTSVFKNTGHSDVTKQSESSFISALAQQPLSVAIEADTSAFQSYAGGILDNTACGTQLDHGVTAVGYGTDFYKIRNSWGPTWGEEGYIRMARTGNGAGMCGVQNMASYPTL